MAINRFNKPVNSQVISQFAPKDLNMIAKVLSTKQGRFDQEEAKNELLQDQFSQLSGLGDADNAFIKQKGQELDDIAKEFSGRDLSDHRIAKELRTRSKAIANDPMVMQTQRAVQAAQAHSAAVQEAKSKGNYRPENDPFLQQLQGYQGAQSGQSLQFSGIIKSEDERAAAEKYFDNIPKSGLHNLVQIGDSFKKVGWEGIGQSRLSEAVQNSVNSFSQSAAGQQALRRYNNLAQAGQLPLLRSGQEITPEQYITSILASAADERKGGISTQVGGAINPVTGQRQASTNVQNTLTSPGFTTPLQKKLKNSSLDFTDEGQLEGSGSSSFVGWLSGDNSFSDIFSDNSLTDKEKNDAQEINIKSQLYGVTPREASDSFDNRINPEFVKYNKSAEQTRDTNLLFKDGAGHFQGMNVYTQDGELTTGQQYFEDLGWLDDGVFDYETAKKQGLVVMGRHNPDSGVVADGWHVSTPQGTVIFEEPTNDQNKIKRKEEAHLRHNGVALESSTGRYMVYNPKTRNFGYWDEINQQ